MTGVQRVVIMAEMHGRDLVRRHIALVLLVALPLCFYLAAGRHTPNGVGSGAIGVAFAVSGATLFSAVSSLAVDQRLVLGGYRPVELLLGRLLFLGPLGLAIAAGFGVLMSELSHPVDPWLLGGAVGVVAVQSVPFGLAVAAVVPRELEGTLLIIGVVGMQMATRGTTTVAKFLPFYGPRRLVDLAMTGHGAVLLPVLQTLAYALTLLVIARVVLGRRLVVHRPAALPG